MVNRCKKKSFFEKVKEHRKEIVVGVAFVFLVAVAVSVIKNRSFLKSAINKARFEKVTNCIDSTNKSEVLISSSIEKADNSNLSKKVINVKDHIRNLAKGRKASIGKLNLAKKHGYNLNEGQTWVETYTKLCS